MADPNIRSLSEEHTIPSISLSQAEWQAGSTFPAPLFVQQMFGHPPAERHEGGLGRQGLQPKRGRCPKVSGLVVLLQRRPKPLEDGGLAPVARSPKVGRDRQETIQHSSGE